MKWKILAAIAGVLFLLPVLLLAGLSVFSRRPSNLGLHGGELSPCPNSPNCVSSRAADKSHHVEPLVYTGPAAPAWLRLATAASAEPRSRIVSQTGDYMHVECMSALFRFVDDMEFQLDEPKRLIHVRSASRVGRGDFGANRSRVERIRARFAGHP